MPRLIRALLGTQVNLLVLLCYGSILEIKIQLGREFHKVLTPSFFTNIHTDHLTFNAKHHIHVIGTLANNADPDHMTQNAAADQVRVYTVCLQEFLFKIK